MKAAIYGFWAYSTPVGPLKNAKSFPDPNPFIWGFQTCLQKLRSSSCIQCHLMWSTWHWVHRRLKQLLKARSELSIRWTTSYHFAPKNVGGGDGRGGDRGERGNPATNARIAWIAWMMPSGSHIVKNLKHVGKYPSISFSLQIRY